MADSKSKVAREWRRKGKCWFTPRRAGVGAWWVDYVYVKVQWGDWLFKRSKLLYTALVFHVRVCNVLLNLLIIPFAKRWSHFYRDLINEIEAEADCDAFLVDVVCSCFHQKNIFTYNWFWETWILFINTPVVQAKSHINQCGTSEDLISVYPFTGLHVVHIF